MSLNALKRTLSNNRWRYASLVVGFFLFMGPFALFSRGAYFLLGNVAAPDLHTVCFRMPFDWLVGGRAFLLLGSVAAAFILGAVAIAFVAGPLFCGWLCPVGGVSEGLSRAVPLPDRFRLRVRDTNITKGLRYGFFVGFLATAVIVGNNLSPNIASVCCRYCSSSVLQNMVSAVLGTPETVSYWHTGSLLTLFGWLLVGGIFTVGGRGWCLFFCPLGAMSGLAHRVGSRFGLYQTTHDPATCNNCAECQFTCPMWATKEDGSVDANLCIGCKECVNGCPGGAYRYGRGPGHG
jgi:polyferredoxin